MYQQTVTMFYTHHAFSLKGVFVGFCSDISMKFSGIWPFCTRIRGDIRSVHQIVFIAFFTFWAISDNFKQKQKF